MEKKGIIDYIIKVEEISKIGLKYSTDPYAIENYRELERITEKFLLSDMDITIHDGNFFKRDIYPTPNISVRTIIFDETKTKVLLVQEKSDGGYSLPGGWSELTLSPSESAKKEVREEAGAESDIIRIVGVTDRYKDIETTGVPEYILTFLGRITKVVDKPCNEIISCNFFPLDSLPTWSFKNQPEQMVRLIDAAKKGETIFD